MTRRDSGRKSSLAGRGGSLALLAAAAAAGAVLVGSAALVLRATQRLDPTVRITAPRDLVAGALEGAGAGENAPIAEKPPLAAGELLDLASAERQSIAAETPRRPPRRDRSRPGGERWYLVRFRELAAADSAAFAAQARERVAADASRAETMAWLRAARQVDAALEDELLERVLDPANRAAPELRDAVVGRLVREAAVSEAACSRLQLSVVRDARHPDSARCRAAAAVFAHAPRARIDEWLGQIQGATDSPVRAEAVRALRREAETPTEE